MSNKNLQRRKFIKAGAMGMAAFTIVPRHVLGKGHVAPSDKLRIAGIGAGGKGESDLTSFAESKGIEIEFKGGLFAQNIKLQKINEQNT